MPFTAEGASFQLPVGWADASTARFRAPAADEVEGPAIGVSFSALREGATIRALADAALVDAARGPTPDGPHLRLVDFDPSEDVKVGGRPALLLRFLFAHAAAHGERLVVQTIVWVAPAREDEQVATVITAIAPIDAALDMQSRLEKVLASVRFDA